MSSVRPGFEREHHFAGKHADAKADLRRRVRALTIAERWAAAWERACRAHGYTPESPPPFRRDVGDSRKQPL